MVKIKLYVEGGGKKKKLKSACRRGFRKFIEETGLKGSMPEIVASGSRRNAYEDFKTRHRNTADKNEGALLLVDAERAVGEMGPWQHLKDSDGWDRPDSATDDQCHLMVQAMESWFLADPTALAEFYGRGFQQTALPPNPKIEDVPKGDVLHGIRRATDSTTKGRYDKGSHSFEILAQIDPEKVTDASPHARRLIETLFKFAGRGAAGDKDPSSG